eukprot:Skav216981  [mRNA]  locus=scaffold594:161082:162081:- [translate_table: standard]
MSLYNWAKYDPKYYLNGAQCGGICCSITHGALCPVDVVKTRIQLDPVKYPSGLLSVGKQVVAEEGAAVLATGLGPHCTSFVHGWLKFGGNEFFKIQFCRSLGDQKAWDMKTPIMLGASASAEIVADIFLCPLEAARIRQADPLHHGQVCSSGVRRDINLQLDAHQKREPEQGLQDGRFRYFRPHCISHPANSLLSKINKKGAGGDGGMLSRLANIAKETGFSKLCTSGIGPRCIVIGTLTAGQFLIFDALMPIMGVEKFHFHDPSSRRIAQQNFSTGSCVQFVWAEPCDYAQRASTS